MESNNPETLLKNLAPTFQNLIGNVRSITETLEALKNHPSLSDEQKKQTEETVNSATKAIKDKIDEFKNVTQKINGNH